MPVLVVRWGLADEVSYMLQGPLDGYVPDACRGDHRTLARADG